MQCSAEYLSLRRGFPEDTLTTQRNGAAASQQPTPSAHWELPCGGHPVGATKLFPRAVSLSLL